MFTLSGPMSVNSIVCGTCFTCFSLHRVFAFRFARISRTFRDTVSTALCEMNGKENEEERKREKRIKLYFLMKDAVIHSRYEIVSSHMPFIKSFRLAVHNDVIHNIFDVRTNRSKTSSP